MMQARPAIALVALVVLCACVSESSVGASGQRATPPNAASAQGGSADVLPPVNPAASANPQPMTPVVATASPAALVAFTGEPFGRIGHSQAIAGDLDGDGFDDLVLAGVSPAASPVAAVQPAAYVFYGRRTFPANVSVLQADAILRDPPTSTALLFPPDPEVVQVLGDVNGDRLGDFAIVGLGWFRMVLGSPSRMRGALPLTTAAAGALVAVDPNTQPAIYAVGDLNHDGFADLLAVELGTGNARELHAFVIAGHANPWTADALRPAVVVPFDTNAQRISARPAGDLDGDGFADMLVDVTTTTTQLGLLYYGGSAKLAGPLTAVLANARLPAGVEPIADLDGDGRAELSWHEGGVAHVQYGTGERLASDAKLHADLTLHTDLLGGGSDMHLAVGDIDGDGRADLIAADASETRSGAYSGTVYALHGDGMRRRGDVELSAVQVLLAGQTRPALPGQPPTDGDQLGVGLEGGGDVTADKLDDTLVGAPTHLEGDEAAGSVLLIRGRPAPPQ